MPYEKEEVSGIKLNGRKGTYGEKQNRALDLGWTPRGRNLKERDLILPHEENKASLSFRCTHLRSPWAKISSFFVKDSSTTA